jgi:hypothetical protein
MGRHVGCAAVVAEIAMHDDPLGIPEVIGVPVWPGGFLCQVKHCNELLLEDPE